jgi:hypothetical protein
VPWRAAIALLKTSYLYLRRIPRALFFSRIKERT